MNVAVEVLSLLLAALAVSLVRVRDLFATIALLAAYSGIMAVLFALLGAVDVAFTEAVVGTGVSTVLLMALIPRVDAGALPRKASLARAGAVVAAAALLAALLYGVAALPAFGDPDAPAARHVSPAYVRGAVPEMATPNVVTAVLADYRGFDTLIETAVILAAALACRAILARER